MKKFHLLILCCFCTCALFAQENYYFQSSNLDEFATHGIDHNEAILYLNGNIVVWGTTIESQGAVDRIFIQSYEYETGSAQALPSVNFSNQFSFSGYNGLVDASFESMVTDGSQVVVASIVNQFDSHPLDTEGILIFSIDPFSGTINWTLPLLSNDDTYHNKVNIIADQQGGFIITFDIEKAVPGTGIHDFNGLGFARIDPNGTLDWTQEYRLEDSNNPNVPLGDFVFFPNDFHQHSQSGNLIATGTFTNAGIGAIQEYVILLDANGNSLTGGLTELHLDDIFHVTDDGQDFWLAMHSITPNPYFNLIRINQAGTVTGGWDYVPAGVGMTATYCRQLEYNENTGNLELLLATFGAPSENSVALVEAQTLQATVVSGSGGFGTPISFVRKYDQVQGIENFLLLTHPDNDPALTPFGAVDEFVKIHDLVPNSCETQYNASYTMTPFQPGINLGTVPLLPHDEIVIAEGELRAMPYGGSIYDCGATLQGTYRKGDLELNAPSLQVYPNPTSDKVQIMGLETTEFTVRIYDLAGRVCKEVQNQSKLSIDELSPGLYHIRVTSERSTFKTPLLIK